MKQFFFALTKPKISFAGKVFFYLSAGVSLLLPSTTCARILLDDPFTTNPVSSAIWHIPTWVGDGDGTFVGRTQLRCIQNSPLPETVNGSALIRLDSFNPTASMENPSFYGTDLIGNQIFSVGNGVHIKVRAKMVATTPGIVGGIFLYALKVPGTTLHDEIDFEFLTNRPSGAQTNIYNNEPKGDGRPQFHSFSSGSMNEHHIYEIKWLPNQVIWILDGRTVRVDTTHVPAGPMNFHLNIWVPDADWPLARNPDLKPVTSIVHNETHWMSVDWVTIETF